MSWFYTARFDKRRLRRELRVAGAIDPEVFVLWNHLGTKGVVDETARLALADKLEEHGFSTMANCVRDYMVSRAPHKKRRKTQRWRARQ